MRMILVLEILLLGLSGAAREPDYSLFFADHFQGTTGDSSVVEIESSIDRTDRLSTLDLRPSVSSDEFADPSADDSSPATALASAEIDRDETPVSTDGDRARPTSLHDLCNALLTSAQDNDLPVPFFANLIWQESRLENNTVSRAGALGIAQFMPETAAESGLANPFDPFRAIPASARLLQKLREQFGNLGFVAAAYNAGPHRVAEWLEHRRGLPRETRGYVVRVTGRTAEDWRKTPPDDGSLTLLRHMPCRRLPAFAELEQAQSQETQLQSRSEQMQAPQRVAEVEREVHHHAAGPKRRRERARGETAHTTRTAHAGRREAEHSQRGRHKMRKSA